MANWPWPTDSKDDRLRRIIDHYRSALAEVDLEACLAVDNRMVAYGQGWVCDNSIIDVNEMLSAKDISERFGIPEWDIRNWSYRNPDKIRKYQSAKGKRAKFRVGDVLTYYANREIKK